MVKANSDLDSFTIDYIAFEDKPDTSMRVARQCLERPSFVTGLPDMPRLSAEPKRIFSGT